MLTRHYGDHFEIYTNIESSCIPEGHIMLYVNYTPLKKKSSTWFTKDAQ